MILSYEVIRKIHRLEKESTKLVSLEDDFFDSLQVYLKEEKSKIKQNEDIFDDSASQRLFNIKNMVEDILYLRQKKIINKAIMKIKTNEEDTSNFLGPELKMYSQIVTVIEDYHKYLDEVFNKKIAKKEYVLQKVKMLKAVPKFIGTDMQEYGPYTENDLIEVPENIAKLFVNKNIGEIQ